MARSTVAARRSMRRFTPIKQLDLFKNVRIALRSLRISRSALDRLFIWMAERDKIRKKRLEGKPPPWSQDPIFNSHKFCHVFRIFDRGTQFLLRNIINEGSQEHREICFRVILFRIFNRVSTWDALQAQLGPLTWAKFSLDAYTRVLARVARENPLYSPAYQIPHPNIVNGPAFKSHLLVLQMMMLDDLPTRLLSCPRMQDAYELIKLYPGMGQFLSYQMVLDLNMTPGINFPENEWAVCGPGSLDYLRRIFGRKVGGIETEAIKYLYNTQDEHFARLGITDPPSISADRPGISFVDIEHSLCECSKYIRCDERSGTWEASDEPETSDLPVKWTEKPSNNMFGDDSDLSPCSTISDDEEDGDTYEVSHIVCERPTSSGEMKYRIRWTGYAPNEDSWMSAADLQDAPQVLEMWRARQQMESMVNRRLSNVRSSKHPV